MSKEKQTFVLRNRAESIASANSTLLEKKFAELSPADAAQTLHDLQVHQIELSLQNEELRRIQTELECTKKRYFELYDMAPVGYCALDAMGKILTANRTVANLMGLDKKDLITQPLSNCIFRADQDDYYFFIKSLRANEQLQECELRMVDKDQKVFWVHLAATTDATEDTAVFRIILSDISHRKEMEEALRNSLSEKEILLREVHHRVKNNLAAILGLVDMQKSDLDTATVKTAFNELSSRIRSMALVHDQLYIAEDLSQINFQEYLEKLVNHLRESYGRTDICINVVAANLTMDLTSAVPCGLILNELVSNTIQHAFPLDQNTAEEDFEVTITVRKKNDCYTLLVTDNGVGLPDGFDLATAQSLGLVLIRGIAEHQLQGQVELAETTGGTTFGIHFCQEDLN